MLLIAASSMLPRDCPKPRPLVKQLNPERGTWYIEIPERGNNN